jgi:hypothetical protein
MSASKNWPCFGDDGVSIAALTSGSTTTQIVDTAYERAAEDVMVYNPGPNTVFIKTGDATVVATTLSVPVPPQTMSPYRKGNGTHIAVIAQGGNQSVVVFVGEGA